MFWAAELCIDINGEKTQVHETVLPTFFHHTIIERNRRNRITHLQNPDGSHSTTPDQLAQTLTGYFQSIFTTQHLHRNLQQTHLQPTPILEKNT
jgi:hypothetical protein